MTVWRYLCWEDSMFSSIFSGSSASSVSGFMLLTRGEELVSRSHTWRINQCKPRCDTAASLIPQITGNTPGKYSSIFFTSGSNPMSIMRSACKRGKEHCQSGPLSSSQPVLPHPAQHRCTGLAQDSGSLWRARTCIVTPG